MGRPADEPPGELSGDGRRRGWSEATPAANERDQSHALSGDGRRRGSGRGDDSGEDVERSGTLPRRSRGKKPSEATPAANERDQSHALSATRGLVPLLGLVFAVLAIVTDPDLWWRMALLAVPVAAFAVWHRWGVWTPVLTLVVIPTVGVAQWGSGLETSLFLVALLALVAAGWEPRPVIAVVVVTLCVVSPIALALIRPSAHIAWVPWLGGMIFPAVLGWSIRRQERLTVELARARSALADQAVLDERRRIARDVHDLVGHGLAAVMLQVTSARHVLRRSPDSADEALASAEAVGRRSLRDLRRTIGLLRDDDGTGGGSPPDAAQIPELATTFRGVGCETVGDLDSVDPAVGLTLYRIAQEALANATKHLPRGRTTVRVLVGPQEVTLEVISVGHVRTGRLRTGHLAAVDLGGTGHYGLRGMHERAEVVGGSLDVGPSDHGWLVRCTVPDPTRDGSVQTPSRDDPRVAGR